MAYQSNTSLDALKDSESTCAIIREQRISHLMPGKILKNANNSVKRQSQDLRQQK